MKYRLPSIFNPSVKAVSKGDTKIIDAVKTSSDTVVADKDYDKSHELPVMIFASGAANTVDITVPEASADNKDQFCMILVLNATNAVTVDGGSALPVGLHVLTSDGSDWLVYSA